MERSGFFGEVYINKLTNTLVEWQTIVSRVTMCMCMIVVILI